MAKQCAVVVVDSIHCACLPSVSINTIGLFDSLRGAFEPFDRHAIHRIETHSKKTKLREIANTRARMGLICNSYSARSDISSAPSTINAIIAYQSGKFTAYWKGLQALAPYPESHTTWRLGSNRGTEKSNESETIPITMAPVQSARPPDDVSRNFVEEFRAAFGAGPADGRRNSRNILDNNVSTREARPPVLWHNTMTGGPWIAGTGSIGSDEFVSRIQSIGGGCGVRGIKISSRWCGDC